MTRLTVTVLAGALLLAGGAGAQTEKAAKAGRVACKDVKAAMASGKTAEQVAAELGTRVKRVENCMARQKAGKKAAKQGASTADGATATKAKTTP